MDFDFETFLVTATLITAAIWGLYVLKVKKEKREAGEVEEPLIVEYARSFFPVLLFVLVLRSFLVEPFRIPSGSMMPTLLIGDFILVNKFSYGIRLPSAHTKVIELGEPERGDIVVFRYPKDPTTDYIKRVVGLPGDHIAYYNKKLYINNELMEQTSLGIYSGQGKGETMSGAAEWSEMLGNVEHNILVRNGSPTVEGEFTIPEGQYFMMGDNRDNSNDSRYWGTVPEENLVGKAFLIWMNFDSDNGGIDFGRLGTSIK